MSQVYTTDQFERAANLVGYASAARYRARGDFLFKGISLASTNVLEVGSGTGAWAVWAALHGADQVVGIEPEADGGKAKTLAAFRRTIETLGLCGKIAATDSYLEQLPVPERLFDVAVMYNVINHIDEDGVVVLHQNPAAFKRYVTILQDLRLRMHAGGWVIVADCGRDNFWSRLGLRSPLAPAIEWRKHQNPPTWITVFEHAGFRTFDLRWSPLYPFHRLTANRFVQYFTGSHFVVRFKAE